MTSRFLLCVAFALTLLARTAVGQTVLETTACENGSAGSVSFSDALTGRYAYVTLGRVSDCDSTSTVSDFAVDACFVGLRGTAPVVGVVRTTPSSSTPLISYLDAGASISINGPGGELRIPRLIGGPATTYAFTEFRVPTIEEILNPNSVVKFFRPGRYSIGAEGGRDIRAFRGEFDVEASALTKPVAGVTIPSDMPPTLEWTGGSPANGRTFVTAAITKDRVIWDIQCRLADGRQGSYTIPESIWSQVPIAVRSGGSVVVSMSSSAVIAVPVDGLDRGLIVTYGLGGATFVTLAP